MNSGELVKNKRSPKWPAIFFLKGRGGYKPGINTDISPTRIKDQNI